MIIISVVNSKDGVGKTTTSINLGGVWAGKGKKVLLIDMDSKRNLLQRLGFSKRKEKWGQSIFQEGMSIFLKKEKNLFVATGSSISAIKGNTEKSSSKKRLKETLALLDIHFDICIIDCPSSFSSLTSSCVEVADYVLIPLDASSMSSLNTISRIHGRIKADFEEVQKSIGAFLNIYDPRSHASKIVRQQMEEKHKDVLLNSVVHFDVAFARCTAPPRRTHIFDYSPGSNSAQDFFCLSNELWEQISN